MFLIFPIGGIIVAILFLVLIPLLSIFGSIVAILEWLLTNWYVLLMIVVMMASIEVFVLKKHYKKSIRYSDKKEKTDEKKKMLTSVFTIIARWVFTFFSLFTFFRLISINLNGFALIGTLFYTLMYFFAIFFTLVIAFGTSEYYGFKKFYLGEILSIIFLVIYTTTLMEEMSFIILVLQFLLLYIYITVTDWCKIL